MTNQLLPPPGLEPPAQEDLTREQRIALWADLVDGAEELLLAGLRREAGPDADVREAYRRWYRRRMDKHDQAVRRMAESFYRRGVRHGR